MVNAMPRLSPYSRLLLVQRCAAGRPVAHVAADFSSWTDVTVVPGVRPRMRTTVAEPPYRWAEEGTCGPFRARLELAFVPEGDGCRVTADFVVHGAGLGPLVTRGSRSTVAADLRRAAREAART